MFFMARRDSVNTLADKDRQIIEFIGSQIEERGYPPTVREICAEVKLSSTASVYAHLNKLERLGYIKKEAGKNRSLKLTEQSGIKKPSSDKYLEIPIVGKITAGQPIAAVEDYSGTFALPMAFAHNKELFMLKVRGESMINAGIFDGDYIIVEKQTTADNGDIVAVLIDGEEATVKRFYREDGHFRLQPENDSMDPIIVDEVSILGHVVGLFRKM